MIYSLADKLYKLTTQPIAEAGSLTGSSQNENSMDASFDHMFKQSLRPDVIKLVTIHQRCDQWRYDSTVQWFDFSSVVAPANMLLYASNGTRR